MSSTFRSNLREAGFAGQLIAALGAVFALLGPFGIGFLVAGTSCLVVGVILAAPDARKPGPFLAEWWAVLAIAAVICLAGFGLSFVVGGLGGILAAAAAVIALVAVALGAPPEQ
ncbi:MAG: hypothetical protein JJE13_02420 [Thermoleophilia bacterium]|nr:hypothetical protein [Thermoleophilia bacterium]